jgi:arylsulfatase A-like enzyme
MNVSNKTVFGIVLIFIGILFNGYSLEFCMVERALPNIYASVLIVNFQIILILFGILLIMGNQNLTITKSSVKITLAVFVFTMMLLLVLNGYMFIKSTTVAPEEDGSKGKLKLSATLLNRMLTRESTKISELQFETREILYSMQDPSSSLTVTIPLKGVLDGAFGIDPMIKKIYSGNISFEIRLKKAGVDEKFKQIYQHTVDLSLMSENKSGWENISIDLSEYEGEEIVLEFNKYCEAFSFEDSGMIYDLKPTALMYWQIPQIRSNKNNQEKNVILISLDTLRADHLHYSGYSRETSPNIDKLAEQGINFTTTVSQAPWTTPSHFSIFTSKYPSEHMGNQPIQNSARHWDDSLPTLAGILRDHGYVTGAFVGRGPISAKFGFYRGFDFYNETNKASDVEIIFKKSMQWLENNQDRDFFLFIHTYEPHAPYIDDYFVKKERIDKSNSIQHRTALYDGDIRRTDKFVGKLIDKMEALGLLEDTILIITSDHGEDLGGRNPKDATMEFGHGHNLYDESLLVPLIFYNTNVFLQGKKIPHQVRLLDITPTILDYVNIKEKFEFQGASLKEMIEGKDNKSRPAYSEATTYGTERESIRFNDFKYVHRISFGQITQPESYGLPITPLHELFNLKEDPFERNNIAHTQEEMVHNSQELISFIFPEKEFDKNEAPETKTLDLSKDESLLNSLRGLGYIE